jgi:hypothetical protein
VTNARDPDELPAGDEPAAACDEPAAPRRSRHAASEGPPVTQQDAARLAAAQRVAQERAAQERAAQEQAAQEQAAQERAAPPASTADGLPVRRMHGVGGSQLPGRGGSSYSLRPSGRHRRAVPASLPQTAPALILAVPGTTPEDTQPRAPHARVVSELSTVLSLDNPAIDVRTAWIDAGPDDPASLAAVLADAASARPASGPCAVVVPLIAAPHGLVMRTIREVISASGVGAAVGEFVNANPLLAEALHIRLAEAGLARADRVRLFSIVTAADGVVVATVGGDEALQSASITSFLLSARLAIPVLTASLDASPSIEEAAMRLKEIGATRVAIAPCVIGPELVAGGISVDGLVDCAAPLGAGGNVIKLVTSAYGQAISELEPVSE